MEAWGSMNSLKLRNLNFNVETEFQSITYWECFNYKFCSYFSTQNLSKRALIFHLKCNKKWRNFFLRFPEIKKDSKSFLYRKQFKKDQHSILWESFLNVNAKVLTNNLRSYHLPTEYFKVEKVTTIIC